MIADFDYPLGTPDAPSIGGVPWDGGLHLVPHPDVEGDQAASLFWRISFDLMWVMASLITIVSKATNKPITFNLNRPQMWCMWNILDQIARGEPVRLWCLKGRQFGYSTFFTTILFICTALRGQNSLLLAHMEKPGQSIFRKAEMALQTLPSLELTEQNEDGEDVATQVITLVDKTTSSTGGSLMAWIGKSVAATFRRESAENRDAGVGETYQNIQLTEVPLFADADHTIPGLVPAMSREPGSIMVGEFTARGEGDFAHRRWLRAASGKGVYRAVFAAWYWYTDYARSWAASDYPLTPEELDYRNSVALKGHEFPLTEEGFLIPRLRKIWMRGDQIKLHDIAVGFHLTDEQLLFRRDMIDEFAGDYSKWQREFPATPEEAFQVAGRKLIPSNVMDKLDAHSRDPLEGDAGRGEYQSHMGSGGKSITRWVPDPQGPIHRFELPLPGATYVTWLDPSSGTGVDPSGGGIWKVEYRKLTCVATLSGMLRPHEAARMLARMGRHYREMAKRDPETKRLKGGKVARAAIERNGFGEHVIHEMDENLKYSRILRYTDTLADNWKHGHSYGFPTTKKTKRPMLLAFARACYDGQIVVHCRRMLADMRCMQYLDDRDETIGAPRGMHDDLAMGGGVGHHFAKDVKAFKVRPVDEEPSWLRKRRMGTLRRTG